MYLVWLKFCDRFQTLLLDITLSRPSITLSRLSIPLSFEGFLNQRTRRVRHNLSTAAKNAVVAAFFAATEAFFAVGLKLLLRLLLRHPARHYPVGH